MTWAAVSWAYKDVITSAKLAQMVENLRVHDHAAVDQGAMFAPTAYTPAWTAATTNPAIGNGQIGGKFVKLGRLGVVWVRVVMGSTTTYGTGNYSLGLPAGWSADVATISGAVPRVGAGQAFDSSAGNGYDVVRVYAATASTIQPVAADPPGATRGTGGGVFDNATPFIWASGDTLDLFAILPLTA